jgi:hypothetical protein
VHPARSEALHSATTRATLPPLPPPSAATRDPGSRGFCCRVLVHAGGCLSRAPGHAPFAATRRPRAPAQRQGHALACVVHLDPYAASPPNIPRRWRAARPALPAARLRRPAPHVPCAPGVYACAAPCRHASSTPPPCHPPLNPQHSVHPPPHAAFPGPFSAHQSVQWSRASLTAGAPHPWARPLSWDCHRQVAAPARPSHSFRPAELHCGSWEPCTPHA